MSVAAHLVRTKTLRYQPYAVIERVWDFQLVGHPRLVKYNRYPFGDLTSARTYAEDLVKRYEEEGYECHYPDKHTWVCRRDTYRAFIKVEGPSF